MHTQPRPWKHHGLVAHIEMNTDPVDVLFVRYGFHWTVTNFELLQQIEFVLFVFAIDEYHHPGLSCFHHMHPWTLQHTYLQPLLSTMHYLKHESAKQENTACH